MYSDKAVICITPTVGCVPVVVCTAWGSTGRPVASPRYCARALRNTIHKSKSGRIESPLEIQV